MLSFKTAKELRARAELLPSGPKWKSRLIHPPSRHPTKKVIYLFYRDPIDCIQSLLMSPLVKDHINFVPFQLFKTAEKATRIFTEWLSGDRAWEMQVSMK